MSKMAKDKVTIRQLAGTLMTLLPEGLELPYLSKHNTNGVHLLLLAPRNDESEVWWKLGVNLRGTVRSIKEQVNGGSIVIPTHISEALKKNECDVYLWKPENPRQGARVVGEMLKLQPLPKASKVKLTPIESWAVRLKDHPEFTCVINVVPSMFNDIHATVLSRALKTWKRVFKDSEDELHRKKAHCQYARRNEEKLLDKGNYEISKLAAYSSRAVFARHRITPSSDWVMPTKLLPKESGCIYYNQSGLLKEQQG